jgi:hypothetical protein
MKKDLSYYESAIEYNAGVAEFAETLAPTLQNEEVRRWCSSLAKKHRIHEKRHRIALETVRARQTSTIIDKAPDVAGPEMVAVTDPSEVTINTVTEDDVTVLPDGCSPFHDPSSPNCEYYPTKPEEQ